MAVFPNKRASERIDATLVVYYKKNIPNSGYDLSQTTNISVGGVMLSTAMSFAVGEVLELKLITSMNTDGEVVLAKVVGCDQVIPNVMYKTRAQFVETEPEQEFLIRQLIDKFGTGE